jgi:hypothetical protein
MNCLLCREAGHKAIACSSLRAITIDEAVNHWITNRLIKIYSSEEMNAPILWLLDSAHFRRLSLGDLAYLNRKWVWGFESEDRRVLISVFLSKKTMELFYEQKEKEGITNFQLCVDSLYWIRVMEDGPEEAEEWRRKNMAIRRERKTVEKRDGCPICLLEEVIEEELREINCGHTFCSQCLERCVKTNPLCAMCREPIRVIYS